ncbi:M48 family metalloprotease [Streptacidiphilus sp. PB12-B1b]|uniref:M48 family metallopeptidase n=1 Tax=Streptacidiphilus sp. PB12-B1b TaxID=2705012 RepID=UPI0015FAC0F3|nr:M48 family metallopeptidase [Streptacidiphilus sp. PB12-B1b]QMU75104.1 M48 family metalloprotease [Streptacidiphilus sp. PB12-B1b]
MRTILRALRTLALPLGFYLLTVGLLAGILALVLAVTTGRHPHSALTTAEAWAIGAVVAFPLLYGLYAVRGGNRRRPEGLRVSRQEQPRLWQLVEQAARAADVRAPHALWLTAGSGVAVRQSSWLLGLVPGARRARIGVPQLVGLTEQQLGALLAHELGHGSRQDTPLPGLLQRNRATLRQVLRRHQPDSSPDAGRRSGLLAEPPSGSALDFSLSGLNLSLGPGAGPKRWFGRSYAGYARLCLRATEADARRQEFAADRIAAGFAGRDTAIAALRRNRALDHAYRAYQDTYLRLAWDEGACPPADQVVPAFRDQLRSPDGRRSLAALESTPPRERIGAHDPHPPTDHRITALTRLPDNVQPPATPAPDTVPAPAPDPNPTPTRDTAPGAVPPTDDDPAPAPETLPASSPAPAPGPVPASAPAPAPGFASAEALLTDPDRTWTLVVAALPGVRERRQLPWDELAALAGQAELDAAASGLRTSLTTVLRHRPAELPTVLDAIDDGRWAELADWIPRTGPARTVPIAVGRSLNLATAAEGLHALALAALVRQGRARWSVDWTRGRALTLDPGLDADLGPALDAAVTDPHDTALLRRLLRQESPPAVER